MELVTADKALNMFRYHLKYGYSNTHAAHLQQVWGKNEFWRIKEVPQYLQVIQSASSKLNRLFSCQSCSYIDSTEYETDAFVPKPIMKRSKNDYDHHYEKEAKMHEANVVHRKPHYTYDPIEYQYPMCRVVRHGKNHIIYAPDIVIGDVVYINAKETKVVPCDMIIFESSGQLRVTSYLEIFDKEHQEMFEFRILGEELPPGACMKRGGFAPM